MIEDWEYSYQNTVNNKVAQKLYEYYVAAEPPVRCGVSHLSGLTEPLI